MATTKSGDENAAAEVPVEGGDQPVPSAEAATTGGPKLIRCDHGDIFIIDDKTRVDGTWQEFAAGAATAVIEAAAANGVTLHVSDKKG